MSQARLALRRSESLKITGLSFLHFTWVEFLKVENLIHAPLVSSNFSGTGTALRLKDSGQQS
jgi:hypothetical protein